MFDVVMWWILIQIVTNTGHLQSKNYHNLYDTESFHC